MTHQMYHVIDPLFPVQNQSIFKYYFKFKFLRCLYQVLRLKRLLVPYFIDITIFNFDKHYLFRYKAKKK